MNLKRYAIVRAECEKAREKQFSSSESCRRLSAELASTRIRHTRAQAQHVQAVERKFKTVERNDKLEKDIQARIAILETLKKKVARLQRSMRLKKKELEEIRGQTASRLLVD